MKVGVGSQALPAVSEPAFKLGEPVFTIGFSNPEFQGAKPKLNRREFSGMAGYRDDPRSFQISVPVQPGNSGGAPVDERGNVVGVVTARLEDFEAYEVSGALPQNVNYAVNSSAVCGFLKSIPGLAGKLKVPSSAKNQEAAAIATERAAVLVIARRCTVLVGSS